jgi:ABC-type branched-subunit amino acid transport system substrate-binding protein
MSLKKLVVRVLMLGATGTVALAGTVAVSSGNPASAATKATGKPLVVMEPEAFPTDPGSTGAAGVTAAVSRINSSGGIGGRPIKVITCSAMTASTTQSCGRAAAANPSIVAVLNSSLVFGQFDSVANAAGLAIIGNALTTQDFASPNFFAMTAGSLGPGGAAAILTDSLKAKNLTLTYIDVPAAQTLSTLINLAILAPRGTKLASQIPVPPTASDVAPYIAAVPSNAGGLVLANTQNQAVQLILQAKNSGATYPIALPTSTLSLYAANKFLGNAAKNVYVASTTKLSGPGFNSYEAAMRTIGKSGTEADSSQSVNGWMAVNLFKSVVLSIGPANVTRQQILAKLPTVSSFSTGGLTPTLNFTKKQTVFGGALANIINPTVVAYKYNPQSKKFVQQGSGAFINMFAAS